MTTDELLDRFETLIARGLDRGESLDDLKTAARIIVEARLEVSERTEPYEEDAAVALFSLCIPIPGGPPKKPEYKKKVRKYRRDKVQGCSDSEERQWRIRSSIKDKLKHVSLDEFAEFTFDNFFIADSRASESQPPPVPGY